MNLTNIFKKYLRHCFICSWVQSKTEEWEQISCAMLVIEKLVPKFKTTSKRFSSITLSLEELVPIAVQQISILKFIHSKGYVHKGVKPDNFVLSEDGSEIYIIDFNKSKRYRHPNGQHVDYQKDDKRPKGLPLFHSLNYHQGYKCTRRDDMESLGYCWVYWLTGKLPWSHIERNGKTWAQYVLDIGQCVQKTSYEDLCKLLPPEVKTNFTKYFDLCRQLNFKDEPDYDQMQRLIANDFDDTTNHANLCTTIND